MRVVLRSSSAAILACLISALPLIAQVPPAGGPAQVLVLGTYHFANPGLDVVKTNVADVLSATKQAEVRVVVEALARFRPTKIAVEREPASGPLLDSLFHAYRSGQHELSRNETEQLGFRLAAMLEHPRVYPIDHHGEFPFDAMMEYAQIHDSAFVAFVNEERARIAAQANRRQRENTIAQILRLTNEPTELAEDQATYMRFARVGAGDTYVGAELLSKWYERNIHIFANLQQITEPGDRILVIIGGGHAPILQELMTYDSEMLLVDVLEYLPSNSRSLTRRCT